MGVSQRRKARLRRRRAADRERKDREFSSHIHAFLPP
jgi:hypothetical protein